MSSDHLLLIKVKLGGVWRKATSKKEITELFSCIRELFNLSSPEMEQYLLFYKRENGDLHIISKQKNLLEAISIQEVVSLGDVDVCLTLLCERKDKIGIMPSPQTAQLPDLYVPPHIQAKQKAVTITTYSKIPQKRYQARYINFEAKFAKICLGKPMGYRVKYRNDGDLPWPDDTELALTPNSYGIAMEPVFVGFTEIGAEKNIDIVCNGPTAPGTFNFSWRLQTGSEPFGHRFKASVFIR